MLPSYVYFTAATVLLLSASVAAFTSRGRRFLLGSLPSFALFALLLTTAEIAFAVGQARGPDTAAGTLYTCSMHPTIRVREPGLCPSCRMDLVPVGSEEALGGSAHEITIDPVVVQNMGVRLAPAVRGPLHRTVRAFGQLRTAETSLVDVALKFDGFVEELHAHTVGMRIEKGAPLFAVYAQDLLVAQAELQAAARTGDASLLALARQKLQNLDVDAEFATSLENGAAPQRAVVWKSPVTGVVIARDVVRGSPTMKGQPLLRLADLSTLWLDVRIPQSAASSIQPGFEVTATLDNASKDEVRGAVVFLAPEVDEATRTTTVRIAVDNRDLALRPGTFARAAIAVKLRDDAVLAPAEAVLDTGGRKVVWVAVGKGRFAPQAVHTGATDDEGNVEITDGLTAGQQVVVSGQFLIDSESRLREGSRKFEEDGLMKDGELPPPASVPLSPESQRAIDAVFAAYIRTSEAFADDRFDLASWNATKEAADAAVRAVREPQAQLPITEFARQLDQPSADIEAARVSWKKASILAIALFDVARPRGQEGGKLYVHHCPMAEADWLQIDDKTRNPYYGSSMLECGEVRRSMPFGAAPQEGAGK